MASCLNYRFLLFTPLEKKSPCLNLIRQSSNILERIQEKIINTHDEFAAMAWPQWTLQSKRVGSLAMKVGCMQLYDQWGVWHAVTVLKMEDCQIIQTKTKEKEGYFGLQVGAGPRKLKRTTMQMRGHFLKAGVLPKSKVCEFKVTEDAMLPLGFQLSALHYVPGQFVDIAGVTIGKGFQGPMKRWGFAGQPASHGVSKAHRSHGSTGQCQDPGRVFKGKKMAGRMGGNRIMVRNLKVMKIDPVRDLIYVKGAVPGNKGETVEIRDAFFRPFKTPPPFPTYFKKKGEEFSEDLLIAPIGQIDPMDEELLDQE